MLILYKNAADTATSASMKTCKVLLLFIAGLLFTANIYCDDENASSDEDDAEGSVCKG